MAAGSAPYSNLHLHFFFGGGCGNCTTFKREGGPFDKIKNALAGTGVEIDETHAIRWDRGLKGGVTGKLQRKFLESCDKWWPAFFVIRKDVYDRADDLPLLDVLKTVMYYNGRFDFSTSPPTPINLGMTPKPPYGSSIDEFKRFLNDYKNSAEYRHGDSLLSRPSSSTPVVSMTPPSSSGSSRQYVDLSQVAPLASGSSMKPSGKTCTAGQRRIMARYS